MNELDRKLYELLGDKNLSFGCVVKFEGNEGMVTISSNTIGITAFIGHGGNTVYANRKVIEIIGHEPTLTDLHRWMNENVPGFETRFEQTSDRIIFYRPGCSVRIKYDSSKYLLSQSDETKLAIINLIESYDKR